MTDLKSPTPSGKQSDRNLILDLLSGKRTMSFSEIQKSFQTTFTNSFSEEVYNETYKILGRDKNINDTFRRVAEAIASVEKPEERELYASRFYLILTNFFFVPGGRITSNAGSGLAGTVLINCFVDGFDGEDQDSLNGILEALRRQALTLKSEGGYGFCADVMRPKGGYINGIGNFSPGSVKMLDMWDMQSGVITQGDTSKKDQAKGKKKIRKGAQMVTLSCWHPDIEEFVISKQTPGRLTKFNMSVLVTDEFMHAVQNNLPWSLEYPDYDASDDIKAHYKKTWNGNLKKWKEDGMPVKVYKTFSNANELWDLIVKSTYNRNEPGVLFQDTMNRLNNLAQFGEYISATNPCGEQILPIGGSCLLGSLNLVRFVDDDGNFDKELLQEVIKVAVRFMDNVNDVSYYPLPHQKEQAQQKRRIGLGVLGYASLLLMMKMRYGSQEAIALTEEIMKTLTNAAYCASADLAGEKGSFKLYDQEKYLKSNFVKRLDDKTKAKILANGIRNSHLTSIQPTGNSSVFANLVSGGQEPIFSFLTVRTKIITEIPDEIEVPKIIDWESKKASETSTNWKWIKEGDEHMLLSIVNEKVYKIDKSRGLLREEKIVDYGVSELMTRGEWDPKAPWAATAMDLKIEDHLNTMEVFAKWVDAAASKTVNVAADYPFEDFKGLYMKAWQTGVIKGITTYRDGTMASVLATESSAKKAEGTTADAIVKTTAPKRPKSLPCDIHRVTAEGKHWVVIVGLLGNDPYEVFAFKEKELKAFEEDNKGFLVKAKGREYNLEFADGRSIKNLKDHFETDAHEALTRMISTALRHGADIEFAVGQLSKSEGNISSFSKAIARVLKKYLKEVKTIKCSDCGSKNVVMQEGCFVCLNCASSKCG